MTTLKGVFPDPKPSRRKNFILENVKFLRHMENLHNTKKLGEIQNFKPNEPKKTGNKHQNILPKPNSDTKKFQGNNVNLNAHSKTSKYSAENQQKLSRKCSMPVINKNVQNVKKMSHSANVNNSMNRTKRRECKSSYKCTGKLDENPMSVLAKDTTDKSSKTKVKLRDQGIQTLDTSNLESLYSEGIIRYPSKKCLNNDSKDKDDSEQNENVLRDSTNASPSQDQSLNSKVAHSKEEANINKLNKECAANKPTVRLNSSSSHKKSSPPSNYRKGVVPKYIKERKEAQKKEEQARAEALSSNCPNGHVEVPENERKETLNILKKNYQDYVKELTLMPLKSDTLRAQQRKAEIEKQLNKLEEGIKVFSKPKVYVKMNA